MILWAVGSLLAGAAAATAARSLRGLSRGELEEACRRRKSEHLVREVLLGQQPVALAAECLQVSCDALFFAALALLLMSLPGVEAWSRWSRFAAIAVTGGLTLLAAGVWIPAALARVCGAPYVATTWPLWRTVSRLLGPFVLAAQQVDLLAQAQWAARPRRPMSNLSTATPVRCWPTATVRGCWKRMRGR